MIAPNFDFSHLTPEERIQLAEELWDSLSCEAQVLTEAQQVELARRLALHESDPDRGRPWREVMDTVEQPHR